MGCGIEGDGVGVEIGDVVAFATGNAEAIDSETASVVGCDTRWAYGFDVGDTHAVGVVGIVDGEQHIYVAHKSEA